MSLLKPVVNLRQPRNSGGAGFFLSPFQDAPEYLSFNGNKRKKFSPHSMINTQEEADCRAPFFGSFLLCKRNERIPPVSLTIQRISNRRAPLLLSV